MFPSNKNSHKDNKILRGMKKENSNLLFEITEEFEAKPISGLDSTAPTNWYFSWNNSFARLAIYELVNIAGLNKKKLDAEIAVFSGNLLKLILGEPQPKYYACEMINSSEPMYVRVSNEVRDYSDWSEVASIIDGKLMIFNMEVVLNETHQLSMNIRGLTSMLIMGYFLDEQDWSGGNFGLTRDLNAVRLDPGLSFGDGFFFKSDQHKENIYNVLTNVLENFVWTIEGENYLSELGSIEPKILQRLFNSKTELFATLAKIISMPKSIYLVVALDSFSNEHFPLAFELIKHLLHRANHFQEAAMKLNGFKWYYDEYIAHHAQAYQAQLLALRGSPAFSSITVLKSIIDADLIMQEELVKINQKEKTTTANGDSSSALEVSTQISETASTNSNGIVNNAPAQRISQTSSSLLSHKRKRKTQEEIPEAIPPKRLRLP